MPEKRSKPGDKTTIISGRTHHWMTSRQCCLPPSFMNLNPSGFSRFAMSNPWEEVKGRMPLFSSCCQRREVYGTPSKNSCAVPHNTSSSKKHLNKVSLKPGTAQPDLGKNRWVMTTISTHPPKQFLSRRSAICIRNQFSRASLP